MSDYANAINQAIEEQFEQLRNYGRLLAQAGIDLNTDALADDGHVRQGYRQQITDYPNG